MSLSVDATQLAALLATLTQPDTEAIRNAEATLKPILNDQRCVHALFEILLVRGAQSETVRHMAAVLLRKRISRHFESLPSEFKTKIKADLLQIMASENERTVRNGAIGVASTICKLECPEDEKIAVKPPGFVPWPELFQFISAASLDQNPEARELSFLLINEMGDTIATYLSSQFNDIARLFESCLANGNEQVKVKTAAVKALGGLIRFLMDEPEVDIFCNLIPPLLQYSVECQKRHDEDTVHIILEVLYDLPYSPSAALTANMSNIVRFCIGCMADESLDMNVRDTAALAIATMAEIRPKAVGKDVALVRDLLELLFSLIENCEDTGAGAIFDSNPAWREDEGDDIDDFDDEKSASSIAQGVLDTLACEIPKKCIFQQIISMCLNRLTSPNEKRRKAGVSCIGVIAEGCKEPLREHLNDIMPHVLQCAGDLNVSVRECVCFALGQISEHCQPEILDFSSQVLPVAFTLLDDSSTTVQATSCYVLEMFCERLEPESVRPFLDPLVRKLAGMLESTSKRSIQEMATAAIAATAVAAEKEFIPYVEGVATLMTKLMGLEEEAMYSLRGRALECMGYVAIAVGKEKFRPYFAQTMQHACKGLTIDSTDLHEYAYALFANLVKVMEDEFSPCLSELVPHLLTVIEQDDGCFEAVLQENQNEFVGLDDIDNDEGKYMLKVRTGMLDKKKGAITAIGEISEYCGASFVPYLEKTLPLLQKARKNWHPRIKTEVATALSSTVVAIIATDHKGSIEWEKGNVSSASPMSARTTAVVKFVLTELVELMEDEDEITVGKACEGINAVINYCGPHSLVIVANKCLENTLNLLTKKAPCQLAENFEADDDDDDDDEHDSFMTSVCDLVAAFAQVMGTHFVQYLPQFLPAICNYAKSSRSVSDRNMSVGCLGEIAEALKGDIRDHWKTVFLPAILVGLTDEDHNVKHNAAFCTGVSCEGLGDFGGAYYLQILQPLGLLFDIDPNMSDSSASCVDNAAAAVARMIMTSPGNVPMPQVLPVLLKALPLKHDFVENETVFNCLLGLIQINHPEAVLHKEEFKRVFIEATAVDSKVDDVMKGKLKLALASIL